LSSGKKNTYHNTALVKMEGVEDVDGAQFYLGKRVAYVYKVGSVYCAS
jgi:large subunit ribosomal protein L35Ae